MASNSEHCLWSGSSGWPPGRLLLPRLSFCSAERSPAIYQKLWQGWAGLPLLPVEVWKSLFWQVTEEVAGEVTGGCSFPAKRGREAALRSFADGHRELQPSRVRRFHLLMDLIRLPHGDQLLKSTHLQYSFNGLHRNVHDGLKQERGRSVSLFGYFTHC